MQQYQTSRIFELFEKLYQQGNRSDRVFPDPLSFVLSATKNTDRESIGLVASTLAYGRVSQIHKSLSDLFARTGSVGDFLAQEAGERQVALAGFRHRFHKGPDLAELFTAIKRIREEFGSLKLCFLKGLGQSHCCYLHALCLFAAAVRSRMNTNLSQGVRHLLPDPWKGSALKRLNLFLRWMIRFDKVDPGVWSGLSPARLITPLDVHIHRLGRTLGFTTRNQSDMRTALEITAGFRRINPRDPLKYDFVLARRGMEGGGDWLTRFAA